MGLWMIMDYEIMPQEAGIKSEGGTKLAKKASRGPSGRMCGWRESSWSSM